ncbi:F0F1 ATP synthase subunit A [Patescibacteria group bacterium]|nr:F0F1 ATP synthase subunit A [Patescibacteria group bacterium]
MKESFLRFFRDKPEIQPEIIYTIGDFPVTNSLLLTILIIFIIIIFVIYLNKKINEKPKGIQNIFEYLYESMLNMTTQITGSKKVAENIFPLIGSLFIFIGLSNLMTLIIPGLSSITFDSQYLFRTPTNDFNMTFALSLGIILLIQIQSIKSYGFFGYLGRFLKFKEVYIGFRKGISSGLQAIIDFFVGILDIISEIAKIISLSLRLFGNIYAGEVLATLIFGAFAYGLPTVWAVMSLLTAIVQSIVFGALVAAYYSGSIDENKIFNN